MQLKRLIFTGLFLFASSLMAQQVPFAKAKWISAGFAEDAVRRPCPIFSKAFRLNGKIRSARLAITAHGLYEAVLNDRRVGLAYFTPGFTDYDQRLQYQCYDVSALLGRNNYLRVTIGDGWYRGVFNEEMQQNTYGKDASLLAELDITSQDGKQVSIVSDGSWQSDTGPILYSDLYNGELQDTRLSLSNPSPVKVANYRKDNLVSSISPAVTCHEIFRPRRIFITPKGEQVVDFGQNLAGWVKLRVNGKAGDTVRISHAEALDSDGNFYTGNLRDARAEDMYILRGGEQTLEPHFTYHGFRYIKVGGFRASHTNCRAVALYSDLKLSGSFRCSNPMLNQLQHNIEWSLKSNFFDIPTDCPQRSERLGWTGDAQVFCRTAAFNRDVKCFFEKWLADLSAGQGANGGMPVIVPKLNRPNTYGVAGWGDAATIIPWTLYEVYGDKDILRKQYGSMKAWVDYMISQAGSSFQFSNKGYGDWYSPGPKTDISYIDQCFFVHSTDLLTRTAKALGLKNDVQKYEQVLTQAKQAFLQLYLNPGDRIQHTQTGYVLALAFDLLPDSLRQDAAAHLRDLVLQNDTHLSTGFLGTPYLLDVLSKNGNTGLAYKVLEQTTPPSWLYPITKGATTTWEKWDAIRPDGSLDTCSLNHYAYGAAGSWLYETVAGIVADRPGYQRISICPHPGGGLTWVKASYVCHFGKIVSNWAVKKGLFLMHVEIPEGVRARIIVPGQTPTYAGPGKYNFRTRLINA